MARKYVVDFKGKTFTRQTERTYSHVIMVSAGPDDPWGPLTWCGRPDLAMKELAKAQSSGRWKEIEAIELKQP